MKLKLNRKREKKRRKRGEERNKIRKREEKGEGKREKTPRPTIDGEITIITHPVAPANYIMIFNGPKGKTWPPKIFGRGVG